MKHYFKDIFVISLLCGFIFGLPGCHKKNPDQPGKLIYRLKWLFNISVVGDLWADIQGNFKDNNLSVIVKSGGPEKDAIKELELGYAHFGVASADQVIRAVSKGSPVVVLAQLFQTNPLQWMYQPEKTHIQSFSDLRGKVIGVTFGGNDEVIMNALLTRYHINKKEVTLFSVRYDYTPFFTGEVDLWPVYRNAEGVVIAEKLRKAGVKVKFLSPDAAGIGFVANSVITTENMLNQYPETVEKFMDTLLTSWHQSLDPANSTEAIRIVNKFDRNTPANIIALQLQVTRPLMFSSGNLSAGKKRVGKINVKAWKQTETIMLKQQLISKPVHIENRLCVKSVG
jgi:NitT/TauT family transport system substrate-binding protein